METMISEETKSWIIAFLVLGAFVYGFLWLVLMDHRRTKKRAKMNQKLIPSLSKDTYFSLPGLSPEQGKDEQLDIIKDFFSAKVGTLSGFINHREGGVGYYVVIAKICRSLAVMPKVDQEGLRTLWILRLEQLITETEFLTLALALIWGQQSAEVPPQNYRHERSPAADGRNPWLPPKGGAITVVGAVLERKGSVYHSAISRTIGLIAEHPSKVIDNTEVQDIKSRLSTGSKLFTAKDIPGSIFEAPENDPWALTLGKLDTGEVVRYNGDAPLVTVAQSGSGKSLCHVVPNLLTWPGPAVVLDVKGELFKMTAQHRQNKFGPVYKFNPFSDQSHGFNPLDFLSTSAAELWEEADALTNLLILPSHDGNTFWDESAQALFMGVLIAMVVDGGQRDFHYIFDALADKDRLKDIATTLSVHRVKSFKTIGGEIKQLLKDAKKGDKILSGVRQTVSASLKSLRSPRVETITQRTDWTPATLRAENATVYLCLDPSQIKAYAPLLRVILGIHIKELVKAEPPKGAAPILFMLDELPRLGFMQPIVDLLDIARGYELRTWVFSQTRGQLTQHYESNSTQGDFLAKCAVRCFMNPTAADRTVQHLSEAIGTREEIMSEKTKPLIEPGDLRGPEFLNKVIILGRNAKPMKLNKIYVTDDPIQKEIITKPELQIDLPEKPKPPEYSQGMSYYPNGDYETPFDTFDPVEKERWFTDKLMEKFDLEEIEAFYVRRYHLGETVEDAALKLGENLEKGIERLPTILEKCGVADIHNLNIQTEKILNEV